MSKQSCTHTHICTNKHSESSSRLAGRYVHFCAGGEPSSFTFAPHPYWAPAVLHSLEVHLWGEKYDMDSFLYLDLRTNGKPNVGCMEQLFCLLPCLQQTWKFTLCIAKGHVSLSTMNWLILHWHLQSTLLLLSQDSVGMKTRTCYTKASFPELCCSSCNSALSTKPRLFFSL